MATPSVFTMSWEFISTYSMPSLRSWSFQGMGHPSMFTLRSSWPYSYILVSLGSLFVMFANTSNAQVKPYQSEFHDINSTQISWSFDQVLHLNAHILFISPILHRQCTFATWSWSYLTRNPQEPQVLSLLLECSRCNGWHPHQLQCHICWLTSGCDWNGTVTQNCLAICGFNMKFLSIFSSWDGSASNSAMFYDACIIYFPILSGKYYLADAEFPICKTLLIPLLRCMLSLGRMGPCCHLVCTYVW